MSIGPRALVAYNGADAGLGNRIRVTLGCQVLAEFENRHFFCVWPTGKLFEPRLQDLWQSQHMAIIPRVVSRGIAKIFPYEGSDASHSLGPGRGSRIRQIRTGSEIKLPQGCASWKDRFRALTPVDAVQDRIRDVFGDEMKRVPYVGVQIRAHAVSHSVTKQTSPVEWYIERMRQIRQQDSSMTFYVSCDVPEVFDRVVDAVPGCHGIRDKGDYNSTAAVQGAVVDLYLLACAGHLIAPHGSSFVLLAHYLANEQLPIETPTTSKRADVNPGHQGVALDPLRPADREGRRDTDKRGS